MVDYKGGRCELCRYDSCLGALGFHHLTRSEKRFSIAGGHGRSWARIRDELDRCVLLCHNCHAEIHDLAVRRGVATWNRGKAHSLSASGDRPLVTCTGCGRRYLPDFRKGHTRRICNSCRSNVGGRAARQALKRRMVEYKGGRCQLCGYARCLRALCFHHRSDSLKRFTIASSHLRSWDSLSRELDTCVLVCHNCHAGVHAVEQLPECVAVWNAHESALCQVDVGETVLTLPPVPLLPALSSPRTSRSRFRRRRVRRRRSARSKAARRRSPPPA